MNFSRAQGATQLSLLRSSTYCPLQGQGATEYLVLLAVVLIVALVSVALLGFFPGMASDAQLTQSKAYWSSASPIAITHADAAAVIAWGGGMTVPYIQVKNNGAYPIRITKILGPGANFISKFYAGSTTGSWSCGAPADVSNITEYYYLSPGEEKYFAQNGALYGVPCYRMIRFWTTGSDIGLAGAASLCTVSNESPGFVEYKTFGFEYIEYIDSQQITKRQIGKPLIIRCQPPY